MNFHSLCNLNCSSLRRLERGAGCKTHTNRFNIICFILIGKLTWVIFRSIFFPTQISVQTCSNSVSVTGIALVENGCYLARIQTFILLYIPWSTQPGQSVQQKTYRVLRLCPKETVEKICSRRVKREGKKDKETIVYINWMLKSFSSWKCKMTVRVNGSYTMLSFFILQL